MNSIKGLRGTGGTMRIIRASLLTLMVFAAISSGFGQTAKPPFTITISADKPTVVAGSHVYIKIKLTNTSDHNVDRSTAYSNGLDRKYIYDVRDEDGKSVEKPGEHHELNGVSLAMGELAPGDSVDGETRITTLYDLTKPGQYTVQLSRYIGNDEKQGVVQSNTITITVLPAEDTSSTQK
jgi:hypothetical protein